MKRVVLCVLFAWSVGCGGGGEEPAGDVSSGSEEPVSPSEPVASPQGGGVPCEQEIARVCGDGMRDGCLVQDENGAPLTSYHVCIPETETSRSQPCEQEIMRECGDGLVDACTLTPPAAPTHICVSPS